MLLPLCRLTADSIYPLRSSRPVSPNSTRRVIHSTIISDSYFRLASERENRSKGFTSASSEVAGHFYFHFVSRRGIQLGAGSLPGALHDDYSLRNCRRGKPSGRTGGHT